MGGGVAIYENPGFPVSEPGVSQILSTEFTIRGETFNKEIPKTIFPAVQPIAWQDIAVYNKL